MIAEFAPAKINLSLKVLGRRQDGYHELQSLVVFADVGDELTLDITAPRCCTIGGPFAAQLAGRNLIDETLDLLTVRHPKLQLGAMHLQKNLPIAAGIGGGSADAAAALRLVRRANPDRASEVDWSGLALELGADVPVCLAGGPALVSGMGDQINPLQCFPQFYGVLVNPRAAMPENKTAQVFSRLQARLIKDELPQQEAPQLSYSQEAALNFLAESGNDLQDPCARLVPAMSGVLAAIANTHSCRLARMSGAGPTCFGLYDRAEAAQEGAIALARDHPNWWIRSCRLNGTSLSGGV